MSYFLRQAQRLVDGRHGCIGATLGLPDTGQHHMCPKTVQVQHHLRLGNRLLAQARGFLQLVALAQQVGLYRQQLDRRWLEQARNMGQQRLGGGEHLSRLPQAPAAHQ